MVPLLEVILAGERIWIAELLRNGFAPAARTPLQSGNVAGISAPLKRSSSDMAGSGTTHARSAGSTSGLTTWGLVEGHLQLENGERIGLRTLHHIKPI